MIENLGVKLYSGTKQDRKSDSLGSSADGTNTGITLTAGKLGTTTLTTFMDTLSESPNGDLQMYNGSATYRGEKAETSSSALIGAKVTKVTFKLKRNGTPTGTASVDVINATGTVKQNIGTISQATLQGLSNSSYSDVAVENTSATYVMVEDDQVVINYSGGDSSNHIYATRTSSNVFDGTNSVRMYNEGSWATDSSLDTIMKIEGYPVRAYSFNGSSSVVSIGDETTFTKINNPNQISTIVFWYKSSSSPSSTSDKIIGTVDTSASARGVMIGRYQGSGKGILELTQAGGNKAIDDWITATGLFPVDGEWYHYAFKFDDVAGKVSIYKDGTLFEEEDYNSWTPVSGGNTQRPLQFGKETSNSKWFNGQIDDCAIYYRGLTTTEIGKLANNNTGGFGIATFNNTSFASYDSANNEIDFEAKVNSSQQNGAFAIDMLGQTVSDTQWTMRMKVNFSNIGGGNGSNISFNIAKNGHTTSNATAENLLGWAWGEPPTDGGTGSGQNWIGIRQGTDSSGASSSNYPNTTSGWYTDGWEDSAENTDYYIELKRTSATNAEFTVWAGSYGGTQKVNISRTDIPSGTVDLRYFKFCNRSNDGEPRPGNTSGALKELSFWNGTNDTTETADYTQAVGDAQLVSSLTNKSELKAYYSMDTALPITDPTSQITTADTGQKITTGATQFRRLDLNDSAYGISGTTGLDSTWTIRCVFDTTAITLPSGNNYKTRMVALGLASDQVAVDANTDRIQWGYRIWDSNGGDEPDNIWGYDQRNSGHGFGIKKFTNNLVPSVSKYFIEVNRLTATSLKITIRTGSHTGDIVRQETFTGEASGVTDLRYLSFYEYFEGGTNNGTFTTIIGDVEIWNGSTTASGTADVTITGHNFGCDNDFSSTSDLEALSGVRTNSLFQQVDDTPSYWWFNGTSWLLDGSVVSNTDMTTSYTGYTGDTGSFEYNSSENGIEIIATTKNKIIVKTLSTTLSKSGKWVARFKVTRLSGDGGDGWGMGFTSSSTSSVSQIQAGGYAYGIAFYVNNGSSGGTANTVAAAKNGTGSDDGSSSGNMTTNFSAGNTLYIEIRHISQTSFECNVFSDSGFSTKTGSVTRTLSEQDYDYDQLSFWTKWGTNQKDGLFEDLEVQNGFSEWQE